MQNTRFCWLEAGFRLNQVFLDFFGLISVQLFFGVPPTSRVSRGDNLAIKLIFANKAEFIDKNICMTSIYSHIRTTTPLRAV
jgi:hypothetical protein